jgi:hypothetical protein
MWRHQTQLLVRKKAGQVRRAAVSTKKLREDLRHVRTAAFATFASKDMQGHPRRRCAGTTWLRLYQVLLKEDGQVRPALVQARLRADLRLVPNIVCERRYEVHEHERRLGVRLLRGHEVQQLV